MWRQYKFAVAGIAFMAFCWFFLIGPLLSKNFFLFTLAASAAVVVWYVVRQVNRYNDPRHSKRPPDSP